MALLNQVMAIAPAADLQRARGFYENTIGLSKDRDTPDGVLYRLGDTYLLVYHTRYAGTAGHTVANFPVEDIHQTMADLRSRGVVFEDYDFPGLKTVNGLASFDGMHSAWFKDTEGNILGITQS